MAARMRVDLLTREFPPHVYGGAGVHVAELAAVLRSTRRRAGALLRRPARRRDEASGVTGYATPAALAGANAALAHPGRRTSRWPATSRAPTWCTPTPGTPTWPATWAACCTACRTWSPRTPWSRCGPGRPSSSAAATRCRWAERTAYEGAAGVIAVSAGMRADILRSYPGSTRHACTWCTTAST